jgi:predicted permease
VSHPPLDGHEGNFFESEEDAGGADDVQRPVTLTRHASPGYLDTLGIPLLRGRDLQAALDPAEAPAEVIVNRTFAELYWPGRDAIGRRVRVGHSPWLRVVGVADDVQHYGVGEEMRPGVYLPLAATTPASMAVVLRTGVTPLSAVSAARDVVRGLDPGLPLHRVTTLEAELTRSLAVRRTTATLFALFAAVALLLAAGGAFGVVSDSVARRRRELGVRLALGARPAQLLGLVLRQGLAVAGLGAAVGLGAALALGRGLEALLFDVEPHDPGVLAAVSLLLLATAALANLLPAWRASRLPPMAALRDD